MSQKRILVTGATGKVGRTFIRRILASDDHRDYSVRALCHNRLLQPSDRLEVVRGAIQERGTAEAAVAKVLTHFPSRAATA